MSDIPPGDDRRDPLRQDRRANPALTGHLKLLARMSGHLAVTTDIDETIRKALDLIIRYVGAEAGSLFLLQADTRKLVCKASAGQIDISGLTLNTGQGIVGQCVAGNSSRIVRDVSEDPDFEPSVDDLTGFQTRSILCAPLTDRNAMVGAIELINKKDDSGLFSEQDLMMLQTLSSAAALAIRNARMTEELVRQERLNREIELAIEMQRSLLPAPRPAPFPVSGINLPVYEVSGDFYDFFELGDGRIYFSLGDVSGKGMDAALLMSKTSSLFRCLGKTIHNPAILMVTINRELCETAIHGMFVTMACGIFDPASGEIQLANAGHEPAVVHGSDGSFTSLPATAPPLGILMPESGETGIRDETFRLNGGTLYIYTDGVTEGFLENGDPLGVDGLKKIIHEHSGDPVARRIEAVVSRLSSTGQRRRDDITILAVEDASQATMSDVADKDCEPLVRITFPAQAEELQRVREVVRRACDECGCTPYLANDLVLAVDEACQNIVRHAYRDVDDGEATLEIFCRDGAMEFRLQDEGPPVDTEKLKPVWPKKIQAGGLGVCLIHDIMDEVEHLPLPEGQGNLLRMVKSFKRDPE